MPTAAAVTAAPRVAVGTSSSHESLDDLPPRIYAAAELLRLDVEAVRLISQLSTSGIPAVLLKGPAIAHWLYEDTSERSYGDIDLLVSPDHVEEAGQVLASGGYSRRVDEPGVDLADDRATYAFSWRSADFLVEIHQTLVGIKAPPADAWAQLSQSPSEISLAGGRVQALNEPARALHLALHAAQHGSEVEKSLDDLRRGLDRLDIETWRGAQELAARLDAQEAFTSGLDLLEQGRTTLLTLGMQHTPSLDVALHAKGARPSARALEWFRRIPRGRRVGWVARKIVPPAGFMRVWHPLARRGSFGLVAAYLWRPFWLAKELVLGIIERRRVRATLEEERERRS